MAAPRALVLTGYGVNCDWETAFAFEKAGAAARRVHVNDLIDGHDRLDRYQILAFPGGFSYGDDIGSGKVLANRVKTHLAEAIRRFIDDGGLVIGICNGFQVVVKYGLLGAPEGPGEDPKSTLTFNDSNRYEDRWVHLRPEGTRCVFTRGIERLYLPVAHGEGKFFTDPKTLQDLEAAGCVVMRYTDEEGQRAAGRFPLNPNGSLNDIAGICDTTGRIFGLMPHPERLLHFTQHPLWTRIAERYRREGRPLPEAGDGMALFRNAVTYFSD
jgi:phosphoribosylformylglycinamidine synthase subunit PurQ / glutaminase